MPPKNKKMEKSTDQDHFVALCSKMNEYRCGDVYCDVDFRVQGKTFKCHRLVLGAASKYFHTMFTGKFKESTEFVITLEEIAADTFEGVLQFIYTGEVSINPANLYGLFHASEYYTLFGLEKACVKYIQESKSSLVENVSQMYSFFRATNREEVADFLDQNIFDHFDNFYRTSEFLKISVDDLRRILEKIKQIKHFPAVNQDIFHKAIMRWTFYADSHSPEEKRKCSNQLIENIDFKKLSVQYMKYNTEWCIEQGNNIVQGIDRIDGIAHSESSDHSPVTPRLHAFTHYYSKEFANDSTHSEVFSCYEEDGIDYRWIHSYSFKHRLPDFMRTVEVNNYLYCLTYTSNAIVEGKLTAQTAQNFITTSSVSLFPQSYLSSPPLLLQNFEMCKMDGNIYVYNKNAPSYVVQEVKNSSKFDKEALSRAVYLYNTETDAWLPVPPLKQKFANACMTSDERMLYLIGGTNSNKYVQGYDHRTPEWIALARTSNIFERAACCVSKAELYVSGGYQNPRKVEIYDPIAGEWMNGDNMIEELYDHEILVDEYGDCITYDKYLAPNKKNVFVLDGEWSISMYDDLIKNTVMEKAAKKQKPEVIHMTLFNPYGF